MATDDEMNAISEEYFAKDAFTDDGLRREAYNDIDIQNKLIEPDSKLSDELALSNFQLGNITPTDYYGNLSDVNFAIDCINTPFEKGGFILQGIGLNIFKKLDIAHIMSGSKNAKKWDSLTQQKRINVLEQRKDNKKGWVDSFRKQ